MAVNYATTYSKNALERFALQSITRNVLSTDYNFVADSGKTVQLFNMTPVELNDYTRSGLNRYGEPTEMQNTVQELACTRERSFSFTIDGLNAIDNPAMAAGTALRVQIDQRVTPEIDTYTLGALAAGVDTGNKVTGTPSADNAYSLFLNLATKLDDGLAPRTDRVAWVASEMYQYLKLDPSFIKASDLGQQMLVNGQVGEVDGVKIIVAPSSYMPTGVKCIMAHKNAAIQPIRLEKYKAHVDAPGINGVLCEGLVYYDAFVLEANKAGIAVLATA